MIEAVQRMPTPARWPWLSSLPILALAGCAALEEEPRLGAEERGSVVKAASFSRAPASGKPPPGWQPWIILRSKPLTRYALVENHGKTVLRAEARTSASGLYREIHVNPRRHPILAWRWRVDAPVPGADPRQRATEDAPARVLVAFTGDRDRLDFGERTNMALAKALSGQQLPYATLMYIWSEQLPVGTVVRNPHTSRIQMIVAASGPVRPGAWTALERNVAEDYRRVFGEEPGDIHAVGVMTDTDNTAGEAVAYYGDIAFRRRPAAAAR
ncbi:MAG: DUF3047 domain-containing protein [Pseudomonadota bacterium]